MNKSLREAIRNGTLVEGGCTPVQWAYVQARMNNGEAINQLTKFAIAAMGTGMHSQRGIQKLIRIELGQQISMISVRTDLRCKMEDCQKQKDAVRAFMRRIRSEVVVILDAQQASGRSEEPQIALVTQ